MRERERERRKEEGGSKKDRERGKILYPGASVTSQALPDELIRRPDYTAPLLRPSIRY